MTTDQIIKIGRLLYGFGLMAIGIHLFIIQNFRPDILPPFAWANAYRILPILTGIALIFAGVVTSTLITIKPIGARTVCLYTGFGFLFLSVVCHLPFILILNSNTSSQLQVWFGVGETIAYGGGAWVAASTFSRLPGENKFEALLERWIPTGRIFFSLLMITFGFSHFVYATAVATMVPKWVGVPMFWTYFFGAALIGSGLAIIFKIAIRLIAYLQAFMLLLFFLFFHIPDVIANPTVGGGAEIVRAIIALLFCGVALMMGATNGQAANEVSK